MLNIYYEGDDGSFTIEASHSLRDFRPAASPLSGISLSPPVLKARTSSAKRIKTEINEIKNERAAMKAQAAQALRMAKQLRQGAATNSTRGPLSVALSLSLLSFSSLFSVSLHH